MNKKDLIARGYFPKELPPPFNTISLADFATSGKITFPCYPKRTAKIYSHNHVRYNSLRRNLGVPNPVFFLVISHLLDINWSTINKITKLSNFSKIKPTHTPHPQRERSISPVLDFYLIPVERAKNRIAGRYILHTDISRFYQSIYTHSIPWAIHGKSLAKQQRNDMTLLGNNLDKILRNSQDGQTLGIPIGPDTSLVIAELILCTTDIELEKRLKNTCSYPFKGFRYSDDYEFVFQNISDAESALSQIQQVLSEFELTINSEKTKIIELPCSLDSIWVLELSDYKFSENGLAQMQDIIRYFDKAFQLRNEFPGEPVLKYAVARISNINNLDINNWSLLESLLLQSITIEPSTLRDSLSIIQDKKVNKYNINLSLLEEVINFQIYRNAILGHSSEVAWAIWSAMVFDLSINKLATESISKMEDSIVAILALNARKQGQIKESLDTSTWEQFLNEDELYGEQWLLCYEANLQGHLFKGVDYVSKDPWFSLLKDNGVTFYGSKTPLVIPPSSTSGPSGRF
ncbi:RNA-directed DNA polymerase [Nostoc sp.]|uniref:RNA-directed DNA polymerase n=1 Tax=Nostoc sp. TaxID=1180 RepID=UPI002FF650A1